MPTLVIAEAQRTGKSLLWAIPRRSPAVTSSLVSVPSSKNRSMSASSASAISSTSASRAACASAACSAGISPAVIAPLPSVLNVNPFIETRSMTPRKSRSCPIGMLIGTTVRPNVLRSDSSERSRLARSRSNRLTTIRRGTAISSASRHTASVWTCTPATASTTTRAASVTRSAPRVSLRKFAIPGVSTRLTLVLFHSSHARLDPSVCLRAISSSS